MTKELVELSRATVASPLPGWGAPEYTNWIDEQMSWKETCYFGDWSHCQRSAMHASSIMKNGALVGLSTMPAYSYYYRKMLSISCIDIAHSQDGEDVELIWGEPLHRQISLRAKVRDIPYKKDHRRATL